MDENGVKYIIYEENSVEINENAEVNFTFLLIDLDYKTYLQVLKWFLIN